MVWLSSTRSPDPKQHLAGLVCDHPGRVKAKGAEVSVSECIELLSRPGSINMAHYEAAVQACSVTDAIPWIARGAISRWTLGDHVRRRAAQRGLPLVWVLATLAAPKSAYRDPSSDGCYRYDLDPIAVVADPATRTATTVLLCRHVWRGRWTESDARRFFTTLPWPNLAGKHPATVTRREMA